MVTIRRAPGHHANPGYCVVRQIYINVMRIDFFKTKLPSIQMIFKNVYIRVFHVYVLCVFLYYISLCFRLNTMLKSIEKKKDDLRPDKSSSLYRKRLAKEADRTRYSLATKMKYQYADNKFLLSLIRKCAKGMILNFVY